MHKELGATPFCQKREMLVKLKLCLDCFDCGFSGLCEPCSREGTYHKVFQKFNEYNYHRRFTVVVWDEVEHAWIDCMLRGLNPVVELRNIYFSETFKFCEAETFRDFFLGKQEAKYFLPLALGRGSKKMSVIFSNLRMREA